MKITMRFADRAPVVVDDVQRMTIELDGKEYELRPASPLLVLGATGGLTIRGERPISNALLVAPGASNMVHIAHHHRDDQVEPGPGAACSGPCCGGGA